MEHLLRLFEDRLSMLAPGMSTCPTWEQVLMELFGK